MIAVVLLLGCQGDYTVQLPNDYFVARVHAGAFGIVNPQNRFVTEPSQHGIAVAVVGEIVIGEIDPAVRGVGPSSVNPFFVVDTRANKTWTNLSNDEYVRILRSIGIKEPPRLKRVGRFSTLRWLKAAASVQV